MHNYRTELLDLHRELAGLRTAESVINQAITNTIQALRDTVAARQEAIEGHLAAAKAANGKRHDIPNTKISIATVGDQYVIWLDDLRSADYFVSSIEATGILLELL